MVHRPIKVNTDVSDRNITPSEARAALNMRFGQVPDDNEQGFESRSGNVQIQAPPISAGKFYTVGVCDFSDNSGILYALWSEVGDHCIMAFAEGITGVVIQGAFLNFKQDMDPDAPDYQQDYSVSMVEINGVLYLQDTVNPPRAIQYRKLLDGYFSSSMQADWECSRIRRKPAYAFGLNYNDPATTQSSLTASGAVTFQGVPQRGNQWAYSYSYSDNTESRLSPYSTVIWSEDVDFYVPREEADNYLRIDATTENKFITFVNWYFRVGNDGPWQFYQSVENTNANYYTEVDFLTLKINVPSQSTVSGTATTFDIANQVFDDVPLLVRDTKLSQNRLMDGNIVVGYPKWGSLNNTITENTTASFVATFHPECTYKIGVNLVDKWGRRNATQNEVTFQPSAQIDPLTNKTYIASFNTPDAFTADFANALRRASVTLTGNLPDWCEYVELAVTSNRTISSFFRTQSLLWQWAEVNSANAFGTGIQTSQMAAATDPTKKGAFKGIAFELNSGEGFNFSSTDDYYVRILGVSVFGDRDPAYLTQINNNLNLNDPTYPDPFPIYFKVVGVQGGKLLCQTTEDQFNMFGTVTADPTNPAIEQPVPFARWYIEVFAQAKNVPDVFYTSTVVPREDALNTPILLYGDCWLKTQERQYVGGNLTSVYRFDTNQGNFDLANTQVGSFTTTMDSVSQSLVNPFSDFWDWDKGTLNVVDANQRQQDLTSTIGPSGQFIPGTLFNRLNQSDPSERVNMPSELGEINGLMLANSSQALNTVLLAWCRNGVATNYLSQAQFIDSTANGLTLDSSKIIGTTRALAGQYGTSRLKHLMPSKTGRGYAYSDKWKDIIRYAADGLNRLGDLYGFYTAIRAIDETDFCSIGFDPYFDEVIFSGSGRAGIAYNDKTDSFQGNVSFENVDRFWTLSQIFLVSFKEGAAYLTSYQINTNLWFNVAKDSTFTLVTNPEPNKIKQWDFVSVDGALPNSVTMESEGKQSSLASGDFVNRNNLFQAPIKRDALSAGGLYSGAIMQGKILKSVLTFTPTTKKTLNFVEIRGSLNKIQ